MAALLPNPLDAAIVAMADRQWGILKRDGLRALGLGRQALHHRLGTGRMHELHPGVYTLGHQAISRKAEFLAAVWWCGGDAALAHESACAFYGWLTEDFEHPPPIHVVTTRDKPSRPGVVVHRTRRLPRDDVLTFERLLRVTDHARTLIDRADRLEYRELRLLADQLRSLPKTQLERKHALLPGRAGWRNVELLIGSEDARAKSELERRFTAYLRHHGIRQPDERNVRIAGCEVDCVYVFARLALELDSRAHHQRRREMLQDKQRDRRYRRAGYTPIRLMWEELELQDATVAEELRERLAGPRPVAGVGPR